MSPLRQKRTFRSAIAMSALPPIADIGLSNAHVRFVPKPENLNRSKCCPLYTHSRHHSGHTFMARFAASFHDLELLNAPPPVGFRDIDAAFGIDGDGVTVGEVADLVSWPAEA